jgi:hypothetical protein
VTAKQASTGVKGRLDASHPCSTPLKRESNAGEARSLESGAALQRAVSGASSDGCGRRRGVATDAENHGAERSCSNVASNATLTSILEAAADTIAALDAGDIEIAKARLRAILALAQGAVESTGCAVPAEP